jgi:hypothetical protein
MKPTHLYTSLYIGTSASLVLSSPLTTYISTQLHSLQHQLQQSPLQPLLPPFLSPSDPDMSPAPDQDQEPSNDLMISDVIGTERRINIFAGFTRDVDPIADRLDDQAQNSTILAPLNSKIQALPRKPWEDEKDYESHGASAYSLQGGGEQRAHDNLRRFVERHIVPVSPWKEGEKVKTIVGDEVWWERSESGKVVSSCLFFPVPFISTSRKFNRRFC